jgi:hypothetical protein
VAAITSGRTRSPNSRPTTHSTRAGCRAAMMVALVTEVSFTAEKNRTVLSPKARPAGAASRRARHDSRRRQAVATATV